jgi:hypothetical protein
MAGEITRDEANEGATVVGCEQGELLTLDCLVARGTELERRRKVHPQLHAV